MFSKIKKAGLVALAAGSIGLILAGCSNGDKNADSSKTVKITVDKGYKDYIEQVKGDFEKKNGVKVKVETKDALTALDNLELDGPAGKAADVLMSPYDRVGVLS